MALLQQAAYNHISGEISSTVLNAYKDAQGNSGDAKPLSIHDCKKLLREVLKSGVTLRIMIDALDECDQPKELLKVLRDVSQDVPDRLELLVSSRYEVSVDDKFPNAIIVDLNESVPRGEMTTYIDTEVRDREGDERLLRGNHPDLEERLINILCRRAGGMYGRP